MTAPWMGRTCGVEMEVQDRTRDDDSLDGYDIRAAVSNALAALPSGAHPMNSRSIGYYRSNGTSWDIKTDSSCAFEVAAPALLLDENGHNRELQAVCGALSDMRPVVDSECGLHVHVDCRDLTWKQVQRLLKVWVRYEPFFYSLQPKHRSLPRQDGAWYCPALRSAHWTGPNGVAVPRAVERACKARTEASFQAAAAWLPRGGLHIAGWWRHGRVEFRLAAGTTNYDKIRRWSQLVLALVARVKANDGFFNVSAFNLKDMPAVQVPTERMWRILGLAASTKLRREDVPAGCEEMTDYLEARQARFALGGN